MKNYKISILIACYNIEKYIDRCLKSCVEQTYDNIEIIVVNDGSTDNSISIIKNYTNLHKNIFLINKPNGGLVSARFSGVKNSTGDFCFFLDGDDSIPKNSISDLAKSLETDTDIVVANYNIIKDGKTLIKSYGFKNGNNFDLLNNIYSNSLCNIWGNLYSRKLFDSIIFPIDLYKSLGEDLVTVTQLVYFSKKIKYVNSVTYNYFIRTGSLVSNAQIKSTIFAQAFDAFNRTSLFLIKKNCVDKVTNGYFKLLKTYIIHYVLSDQKFNKYNEVLKFCKKVIQKNFFSFFKKLNMKEKIFFIIFLIDYKILRKLMHLKD